MTTNEQLRVLAIFHHIVGALHVLLGSFPLIHVAVGLAMIFDPKGMGGSSQPPWWLGVFFVAFGAAFVVVGWTLGILTVLSGRFIARRTHRTFSIVIGAINCLMLPFGTALGVFDIVLLTRDDIRSQYAAPGTNRLAAVP